MNDPFTISQINRHKPYKLGVAEHIWMVIEKKLEMQTHFILNSNFNEYI